MLKSNNKIIGAVTVLLGFLLPYTLYFIFWSITHDIMLSMIIGSPIYVIIGILLCNSSNKKNMSKNHERYIKDRTDSVATQ